MKKMREYGIVFAVGALGYCAIELLWRQRTHWSMGLTGGVCLTLLYRAFHRFRRAVMWKKCCLGAAIITAIEFSAGCVFNLWLKLNVWDYSEMKGNILGQVCPFYTILWALLCFPVCHLCRFLRKKIRCR